MHSGMTVGEIINALRGYPEHYRGLVDGKEVGGVHKASTAEDAGKSGAVVFELQDALPLGTRFSDAKADPLAAGPTSQSRKPKD